MNRLVLPGLSLLGLAAVIGAAAPVPASGGRALQQITAMIDVTPSRKDNDISLTDKKDLEVAILYGSALHLDDIDRTTMEFMGVPVTRGIKMRARNPMGANGPTVAKGGGIQRNTGEDEKATNDVDLIFVVGIPQFAEKLQMGPQEVCVTGKTTNNTMFKGCAQVNVKK